jgi:hypothetical protein
MFVMDKFNVSLRVRWGVGIKHVHVEVGGGGLEARKTKFLTMKIVECDGVKSHQKYL